MIKCKYEPCKNIISWTDTLEDDVSEFCGPICLRDWLRMIDAQREVMPGASYEEKIEAVKNPSGRASIEDILAAVDEIRQIRKELKKIFDEDKE